MSLISLDSKLEYPHPFIIASDNKNPCQTWEKALQNPELKKAYNKFNDIDKKNIDNALKERTCQSIDGVKQCFTVNGLLETCKKLPEEHPKNIRHYMKNIDNTAQTKKKEMITPLEQLIDKKSTIIDNLIQHYTSKMNAVEINNGYNKLAEKNIEFNTSKKSEVGDDIEKAEDLKANAEGTFGFNRQFINWYTNKNILFITIIKFLLIIIIVVEFLFILSIRLE
jgi:hypothetical protein